MDEFLLIDTFFKSIPVSRTDVHVGIGDDAACLKIPSNTDLLVTTDTLIDGVHFLKAWSPYDIAYRSVMVNVSDIAAMGGAPSWMTLALTLPDIDESWLHSFSSGLKDAAGKYHIALVGGDTTRGPLSITITMHGFVPQGKAVRRIDAKPNDKIYVSGELGAAALAVNFLTNDGLSETDRAVLMKQLWHPTPRVDLGEALLKDASAAIDISDGLSADLNHLCRGSGVGALIQAKAVPIHPLVLEHQKTAALDFVLGGGDDYELCFTIPPKNESSFRRWLIKKELTCYCIGVIEAEPGLRLQISDGSIQSLAVSGYNHF